MKLTSTMSLLAALAVAASGPALAQDTAVKGWKKGRGWGWVWGTDDEVGSLNAMTDASRLAALRLARTGKVYDLGVLYDRKSYKWPGHSPGEIMTFRGPEGTKRMGDGPAKEASESSTGTAWHSCALFISDNVATQIDSLAHATTGADNHWYNGFTEADCGGDFGPRKASADTIPPIVARGVLIDVAGLKGVDALPSKYAISPKDIQAALRRQKTKLRPGDVVLVRTGTLRYWGQTGADHAKLAEHDSAGLTLETAKWLIEQQGAMALGTDTSGLEAPPPPDAKSFMPVHDYLLIEQGVHILEFHYLENLARDKAFEFCYVATTNKIKGTTAGFTMRPIALR